MENTKKVKVAINGFGRIGRAFLKIAWDRPEIEIVAINDLGSLESLSYLLRHDSVYRNWGHPVRIENNSNGTGKFIIENKEILFVSEKDTTKLPWKELGVDVVVESTGLFTSYDKAKFHLDCGAKKVVISAPAKPARPRQLTHGDEGGLAHDNSASLPSGSRQGAGGGESEIKGETILLGVNEEKFGTCDITSNGSCTTNAASPLIAILNEALGVEKALLNTVHGYTASQSLVDGPSKKDLREGRAAAQNIVPSSTGAAIAVTEAFPKLNNLFDGISIRVPVIAGSIVDITFISKKNTTKEEVNEILKKASKGPKWDKLFSVTEDHLVSSDILGESHACIADLEMTRVVDGNLVKVLGWYDNEMGYTYTLVDHVIKTGETIK